MSASGEPIRVLHLGRFHHAEGGGGIERHVADLLGHFPPSIRADNLVAAQAGQPERIDLPNYRVFTAPCHGVFAGTALAPRMIPLARQLQRENDYHLVHLHFPDPLAQLVAQCLPARVKRIVTWHSDIVRQKRLLKLYAPWRDYFLARVEAVTAPTSAHFRSSTQLGAVPESRRHIIPFGLDYRRFDLPEALQQGHALRQRLAPDAPLILAVGRHVYYKGFEHLIDALTRLPRAHLALIGQGPLTEALQQRAQQQGLASRVHFLGHLSDLELAAAYHACDLFCLPSTATSEAFGLVQLEAMACGKPVVCSWLDNGVNVVNPHGETGLAVPPADPDALADALQQLLADPERRHRYGQAARQRAREQYSIRAMVEATEALYRQLLQP